MSKSIVDAITELRNTVREAFRRESVSMLVEGYNIMRAIDEVETATLVNGVCKITATATNNLTYPDYMTKWYELSCGHSLTLKGDEAPKWCAVCGKAVKQ